MPQLASVVLKDNANADQTFAPRGIVSGVATLVKSTGVPVGDQRLVVSHGRTSTNQREKITMKLAIPVIQDVVVSGISRPTAVRVAYCDIVFTFDGTSNTTERADVLAYAKTLLGHALATDLVVDLEDVY